MQMQNSSFSSNFLIGISGESWVVRMRKEDLLLGQQKCPHQDSWVFILKDLHVLGVGVMGVSGEMLRKRSDL